MRLPGLFSQLALSVVCAAWCLVPTAGRTQDEARAWSQILTQLTDEARRQLRSSDPKDVAWGAFQAAQYRIVALVPDLLAALQASLAGSALERSSATGALLDAQVQLEARLPAEVLKEYWDTWPVHTSILFARAAGNRDRVLLDVLPTTSGFRWYALANLLAETKPPGFAREVLAPLIVRQRITVSERGDKGSLGGGSVSGGVSDGVGVNPAGYPPKALYRFENGPRRGVMILSTGPRLLYYSRTVTYSSQFGISATSISGPSEAERLDYLKVLLPPNSISPIRAHEFEAVTWEGTEELLARVSALRKAASRRYEQLVLMLVEAQRLTPAEAQYLSPRIETELVDLRDDQSQPLPPIDRTR